MNTATHSGRLSRLLYRAMLGTRHLATRPRSKTFGAEQHHDAIPRIYVINLDRKPDRWRQMSRELGSLRDRSGKSLATMIRRFSAIDARYYKALPSSQLVLPHYSLADQLFVEPNPLLAESRDAHLKRIEMTSQEVAIALSHVEVWKRIAASSPPYTLVLEDDVYFPRGFVHRLDDAWAELMQRSRLAPTLDMVYLSYREVGEDVPNRPFSDLLFRPVTGLWQLSGYVLSRSGAQKLLDLLPVRGPVDLWLNHQFRHLDVFATRRSIIKQRLDIPSTNSYSVLPVLSEMGVLTREKPLLVKGRAMPGPVFAFGKTGSGLTALAAALSMLGYRCCSDIAELPASEHADLFRKRRGRVFDAYVNIGSLGPQELIELARLYRQARFIVTSDDEGQPTESMGAPPGGATTSEAPVADEDWRLASSIPTF